MTEKQIDGTALSNPWTNVYGLSRTLLATGTLLTLLWNDAVTLFSPATRGMIDAPDPLIRLAFFSLLHSHLELARCIAIIALVVVATGWRPRIMGVVHWWIAWSFQITCIPADGGDQVASVLSLILVPVCLSDRRKWHWQAPPPIKSARQLVLSRIGLAGIVAARVQAAIIYFHAAVGKLAVPEWSNGTAMYYWLLDPRIGVPTRYHSWVLALLSKDYMVAVLSWGALGLELALCLVLTMPANHFLRKPLFFLGLLFHVGNIIFFSLIGFFFSMAAVLVIYAWPIEQPFKFPMTLGNIAKHVGARLRPKRILSEFSSKV